jgi:transposase-like protein
MTKPRRYKRFSSEFKREAIMRASEEGMTDKAVCDELGVSTRRSSRHSHRRHKDVRKCCASRPCGWL